jgi:thiamine-monophosphate kinase
VKLSDIGEFGLIDRIADMVGKGVGLRLGIGDDAAAWAGEAGMVLATIDSLVQDVHFSLDFTSWEELGWKALAVNLSDIAAMGGQPRYALVSLALPQDIDVESVVAFYKGMGDIGRTYDVAIAGGDLTVAPQVGISVAVLGRAEGDILLTRSAARPGDLVAVTGHLGASAGGLRMLEQGLRLEAKTAALFRKAHLCPHPRVAEGQALLRVGVRAAIDISDGLLSDLGHICQMSRVSSRVRLDRIPVPPQLEAAFGDEALGLALSGGEDYELLFTAGREVMDEVIRRVGCQVTVIGEVVEGEPGGVILVDEKGNIVPRDGRGWEHFVSSGAGQS